MRGRKIVTAIKHLNIYELNSFRKYLTSPYFNRQDILLKYFDILYQDIKKNKDTEDYSNEELWESLQPGTPYDDAKLRKFSSDLYKTFESFLAQREFDVDEYLQMNLKFRGFKNKEIIPLYNGLITQAENLKNKENNRASQYYLNQFNIERDILEFKSELEKKDIRTDLSELLNHEEISFFLDVFYIAEKLKYYCNYLAWSRSYKIEKKLTGIDIILRLAQLPQFAERPPVAIYYTLSQAIMEPHNYDHYYRLKKLIRQNIYLFPEIEVKEILQQAISYCVVKVNEGVTEFENEAMEMYKLALKSDIFIIDGFMSPTTYRNIVFFGLRTGQFQWVENFIYEYQEKLNPAERDSNRNFCLARLEYFKKNFGKVIEHLRDTTYNNVFLSFTARSLIIISYYELDEYDPMDYALTSFKAYIEREKSLKKERKIGYLNFIKYTKLLTKLMFKPKTKIQELIHEVKTTNPIVNKEWILEKIEAQL